MNPTSVPQGAQPRNDAFDVLTVYNPSDEPFEVRYNSELHAVIQPKKAIQLVKLIAGDSENGAIKHLIDRMCRLNKKPRNEPAVRAQWLSKILVNQSISSVPHIPTEIEQARAINERLAQQAPAVTIPTPLPETPPAPKANPQWKFDPITGAPINQTEAPVITPDQVDTSHVEIQRDLIAPGIAPGGVGGIGAIVPPHPDAGTESILQGIRHTGDDDGKVIGEVPATTTEAPYVPEKNWPDNPTMDDLLRYAKNVSMLNTEDPATKLQLSSQSIDQLKETLKYDVYA